MKMPKVPPDPKVILKNLLNKTGSFEEVFARIYAPSAEGKYLHWDKLRYQKPPEGVSHEEWWCGLKLRRQSQYKEIPLCDKNEGHFKFLVVDPIPERLYEIDSGAGGSIQITEQITNSEIKDQYYVRSLIAEAITSSQLEGAATTRKVAKEMIRAGRSPRDRSEQMILNNYQTMQRIRELQSKPLSKELVFEIHQLVTHQTLDDPSAAGRFRRADERIVVGDMYNEVFHEPPAADQLEERMAAMCDFANGETPERFVHPAIRSIILHFWLAYDHPFVDGNGRTARALFYWSMLRNGFWLFEFISISQIIIKAQAKYERAFLYTETDENDLTYFILYHLEVIQRAIKELHEYINHKTARLKAIEQKLRGIEILNHRQRALVGHALRHPGYKYTIESHRVCHNVVYQTARADLLNLQDRGLFIGGKIGKTWYFTPMSDLEERLVEWP